MTKQVIGFHYTLTDEIGKAIDSSHGGEPMVFLEGARQIIPGLENALISLKKGDIKDIAVPCQEAYDSFDQTLVFTAPRSKFPPKEIKIGDIFQINMGQSRQIVTVIDVSESEVTLDGNHPLAGKDLHFAVEVTDICSATPDELGHGHAHGPHGH